jgi:hypothetical protein
MKKTCVTNMMNMFVVMESKIEILASGRDASYRAEDLVMVL